MKAQDDSDYDRNSKAVDIDDKSSSEEAKTAESANADESKEPEQVDWESKCEEFDDRCKRIAAEFENYKRRQTRFRENELISAQNKILAKLLDIRDHLERALESTKESKDFDKFHQGIELIDEEFNRLLKQENVEEITPTGERFDPLVHEAMSRQEVDEAEKDNTVVYTIQKGYSRDGDLLRPAKVVVGKYECKD